jgi:glutamate synthase domain-containing protein 3
MTGGTVVVLAPVGANFGAGMSGGRALLLDPGEHLPTLLHAPSVAGRPLRAALAADPGCADVLPLLGELLEAHARAGSQRAAQLLDNAQEALLERFWLVAPHPQPDRNVAAPQPAPTRVPRLATVGSPPRPGGATLPEEAAR